MIAAVDPFGKDVLWQFASRWQMAIGEGSMFYMCKGGFLLLTRIGKVKVEQQSRLTERLTGECTDWVVANYLR